MKILVTGAAGFIGFHLVEKLCALGYEVVGVDNINDYYDPALKYGRLKHSGVKAEDAPYGETIRSDRYPFYAFVKLDITDREKLFSLFETERFTWVCHLAAQAGVRYSLENPYAYIDSNIVGFINILEACRTYPIEHLVYASSSSVYGMNEKVPFSISDPADRPVSLYAATKRSNELFAHTYAHLFKIPLTGLRFFTVYGPWGRPDMAYYKFAAAIAAGNPIDIYNNGEMLRDFTYIDDIVEGVIAALLHVPGDGIQTALPSALYNLGNNRPEKLMDFIETLENALGRANGVEKLLAKKRYLGMQAGDVPATMADIDDTRRALGWEPKTSIAQGLEQFAKWFFAYHKA